jgi:hypothetical protein
MTTLEPRHSLQLYLTSKLATQINTQRNRCTFQLVEPIIAPDDNHSLSVQVVSAEIKREGWTVTPLYLLVGSSMRSTNQNSVIRGTPALAKIPVNAPNAYTIQYYNQNGFSTKVSDRSISQIEIFLMQEDGTDINLTSNGDWGITLQVDIVRNKI